MGKAIAYIDGYLQQSVLCWWRGSHIQSRSEYETLFKTGNGYNEGTTDHFVTYLVSEWMSKDGNSIPLWTLQGLRKQGVRAQMRPTACIIKGEVCSKPLARAVLVNKPIICPWWCCFQQIVPPLLKSGRQIEKYGYLKVLTMKTQIVIGIAFVILFLGCSGQSQPVNSDAGKEDAGLNISQFVPCTVCNGEGKLVNPLLLTGHQRKRNCMGLPLIFGSRLRTSFSLRRC